MRLWPIVLLVLIAAVGAWLGAHHFRPIPPDPFAGESFAPVVAASENGLELARSFDEPLPSEEGLYPLVGGRDPAEESWRAAQESDVALRIVATRQREAMDALDARPRFVDDCRPDVGAACDLVPAMRTAKLAGLLALAEVATPTPYDDAPYDDAPYDDAPYDDAPYDDAPDEPDEREVERGAEREAWERGEARLVRAVARARDFHGAPRSLVGTLLGVVLLKKTLDAAAPFVAGARERSVALPRLEAALVEPFAPTSMRRGYLFDHRMMRRAIETMPGALLFDRARTLGELDRRTAALLRYADDPSLPPPTLHVHAEHFGWWLYDPVGKETSDMLASDAELLVVRARDGVAEAEAARVALLARIRGAE